MDRNEVLERLVACILDADQYGNPRDAFDGFANCLNDAYPGFYAEVVNKLREKEAL